MDTYLIKWYDAFSVEGWKSEKDMEREFEAGLTIESKGTFFRENEKYISLIQNSADSGIVSGIICIPKSCIIETKIY
jgi:hypothetical protein